MKTNCKSASSSGIFGFAIWQFALIIVAAVLVLIIIIVTIVVVLKKGKKKEYFGVSNRVTIFLIRVGILLNTKHVFYINNSI